MSFPRWGWLPAPPVWVKFAPPPPPPSVAATGCSRVAPWSWCRAQCPPSPLVVVPACSIVTRAPSSVRTKFAMSI